MSPYYKTSNVDTALSAPAKNEYACIIIGNEILDGHVEDSNLPKLVRKLSPLGYVLREARIVSDDPEDIAKHLTELRNAFTFVVTMGGLGPTHDDRTMEGYALSFQYERVLHKERYEDFMKKPRETKEQHDAVVYMSTMPAEVEIISLGEGWPLLKLDNCFALPGLPSVFLKTIEKLFSILPPQDHIRKYAECYVTLFEHEFAQYLSDLAKKYPSVVIGSYPIDHPKDTLKSKSTAWSKVTFTSNEIIDECFKEFLAYATEKDAVVKVVPPV